MDWGTLLAALLGGGISVTGIAATGVYRLKEVGKQNAHALDVRKLEISDQRAQELRDHRRTLIREWREGLAGADARCRTQYEAQLDWDRRHMDGGDELNRPPEPDGELRGQDWYESLRPHLVEIGHENVLLLGAVGQIADEIARIERQWDLV